MQSKADEAAFPVKVRLYVPFRGFGQLVTPMEDWLVSNVGKANFARHGAGCDARGDRIALYFRSTADAAAFIAAFPELVLADGTTLPGYYSPNAPRGSARHSD